MIRIRQLKLHIGHTEAELETKIRRTLRVRTDAPLSWQIIRQSLDARHKPELFYIYTVDAQTTGEKAILKKNKNPNVSAAERKEWRQPEPGEETLACRPVVIGSGPAGMFCAYLLAELGYAPVLLERGAPVEERTRDVEKFWETGVLDPESNVQFGEGGAGTFSDGKLNTLVKDPAGRNRKVLEVFVKHGAPADILYKNKPHIGTDVLTRVVSSMREQILAGGGEIRFHTQVTDLRLAGNRLTGLRLLDTRTGKERLLETELAVLAIGHSARDTFQMLKDRELPMEPKPFAVGVRVEHPQAVIDLAQYGRSRGNELPAADYKLTANLENGRSVYTFCMCPGGYVVNASSEEGRLAVNGMSYRDRDGENANSAVVVTVRPEDYPGEGALAGVAFQRKLEQRAWQAGAGRIPVQLFEDFCQGRVTEALGEVHPQIKGGFRLANVRGIFPEELAESLEQGIRQFDRRLAGYACGDAVLSGVESRTSSPVRILRDETLQSSVRGIYPCGEGAGYAGGITSAAMDGIKTAEAIVRKYRPFDKGKND